MHGSQSVLEVLKVRVGAKGAGANVLTLKALEVLKVRVGAIGAGAKGAAPLAPLAPAPLAPTCTPSTLSTDMAASINPNGRR